MSAPLHPIRFRLSLLVYILALLGAGLGAFGPAGLVPAAIVLLGWLAVFTSGSPRKACSMLVALLFLGSLAVCCVPPMISRAHEPARRMQCQNNLKQIGLAVHNYREVWGAYPPAYLADATGKPMHSWRVLLLPYLGLEPLYRQYRFDEPWNGPNNRKLMGQAAPFFYSCPSDEHFFQQPAHTAYLAVTGPGTTWLDDRSRDSDDLTGPSGSAPLVLESGRRVHWMQPVDLSDDEALRLLTAPPNPSDHAHRERSLYFSCRPGRHLLFANGSVQLLSASLPPAVARRLLRAEDAPLNPSELKALAPARYLRIDRLLCLALFVGLSALPLVRLRRIFRAR